jgi:hypothetical protein
MLGLVQIRVDELPVAIDQLRDVALLALFVGPRVLPVDEPNGVHWCLRSYSTLEQLVDLAPPTPARADDPKARKGEHATYRPFPLRWREVADLPTRDSIPPSRRDEWEAATRDAHDACHRGLKVGGWPVTVQSDVVWREGRDVLDDVEFVLQVDSEPKIGFTVGYAGVLYVGRRPTAGTWHCSWQSR